MRNRSMGVAAVFVLAAATAAHAQAVPAAYVEVKDDNLIVQDFNLRVAALEDLDVYDASGVRIGDVEDIIGTSPGAPVAITVDVDDFLGQQGEDVVIPFADVKHQDGRLVTSLSREAISKLPRFQD